MDHFEQIKGYKEIKQELEHVLDIIINASKYQKLGVTTPRGMLIYGVPGVGKTLMANCFIKASGRKVFTCRKDKPDGDFVKHIKSLFDEAKNNAPSIVFLDDMDKFANEDRYHRNAEEYVTIQSCIDDVKNEEVFVLATANDTDNLPDSLLRVGRFDKSIYVKNPKGKDAEEIISYYMSKKKYITDIDTAFIAKLLDGKSCAELETVINEAGVQAGYNNKESIEMEDMISACMRIIFNAPESIEYNSNEIESTAYHEAGHTVIAEILEPNSVNIVSVRPHNGNIGGVTSYYQDDSYFNHKSLMENRVISLLGGKAATEIVYGEVDVGANNDLHRAFDIVTRFVDNYCSTSFDRWEMGNNSSQSLIERKEMQIYSEIERYYQIAKKILIQNRDFLDKIAKKLVDKQTIIASDINIIKETCDLKNIGVHI